MRGANGVPDGKQAQCPTGPAWLYAILVFKRFKILYVFTQYVQNYPSDHNAVTFGDGINGNAVATVQTDSAKEFCLPFGPQNNSSSQNSYKS